MFDNLLDDLVRAARRCERASNLFTRDPVATMIERLTDACNEVGKAASGSWIGYQAAVYTADLHPVRPGDYFSREWGPARSSGDWAEYTYEGIASEIEQRANVSDVNAIEEAATVAEKAFNSAQQVIIPALDAILTSNNYASLKAIRDEIAALRSYFSRMTIARSWAPQGNQIVRDPRATGSAAFQAPYHRHYQAWLMERASFGIQCGELARLTNQAVKFLTYSLSLKGNTVAKKTGSVFIGHGRSAVWKQLKEFLQDRLQLEWDEFNRVPTAGQATKERLEQMLDQSSFAFLIMTAEDEQANGSIQARANVIHEVGLFQGRLGFDKAIVLLEDGCEEFSNIAGLGQIRFPQGDILSKSEEIRRVLEREDLI